MEWLYGAFVVGLVAVFIIVVIAIWGTYFTLFCSMFHDHAPHKNEQAKDLERQVYKEVQKEMNEAKERMDVMLINAYGLPD